MRWGQLITGPAGWQRTRNTALTTAAFDLHQGAAAAQLDNFRFRRRR
jgi:hypothetical protein